MELPLQLAIGVLLASLVAAVVLAIRSEWGARNREHAEYRRRCRARDSGRTAMPVDEVFSRHYAGAPIDIARFREMWVSLASYLEIDPELMRPTDRVADIMSVSTEHFGPDSLDLLEFFLDFVPHLDANQVLESVAKNEDENVGDLVSAVVFRQEVKKCFPRSKTGL